VVGISRKKTLPPLPFRGDGVQSTEAWVAVTSLTTWSTAAAALFGRKLSEVPRLLGIITPSGKIPVLLLARASWRRALAAVDRRR
jgi:hypothetical protein